MRVRGEHEREGAREGEGVAVGESQDEWGEVTGAGEG